MTTLDTATKWQDIDPKDAVYIELPWHGIEGPMNELDERCPWPWDPQQLKGAPLGQYHCPYCGGMQIAGMEHLDFADGPDGPGQESSVQRGADDA